MRLLLPLAGLVACANTPEVSPFEGPDGVTTVVTDQDEVMWIATYLRVKNAPGPGKRFGDHADAVGNDLFENPRPGWLGSSFRNVGKLNWWTLSAWESQDDMLAWVVSEPHISAMVDFSDVAAEGTNRTVWLPAEDGVLDWDTALELLDDPDTVLP
jgi:hypothetical protein